MKYTNGQRGLLWAVALGQVLLLQVAGCKSRSSKGANDVVVKQALVGKDGARTVSAANTIVNTYSALSVDADANDPTVTVSAISDLATDLGTDGGLQPLAAGDLLLIIQMAGATIDPNDTVDYGTVTSLNNAGNYELAGVASVASNTITLGCPLKKSYSAAGKTQVIRVPQYSTLTIGSSGSITAPAWNGTVGGVVALHAASTLQLNNTGGSINVTAKGFRGGAVHAGAVSGTTDLTIYRSATATDGGEKGESIAGTQADYDTLFSGRNGRGAPANGGGGGNWHNAGGGGGANAAASGLTWTGQGVMLSTVVGGTGAWQLDPGYVGDYANSPGGGRGGYTYSNANRSATVTDAGTQSAPGDPLWGGNYRRERGGLGGRPLVSSPTGRLFLGGGGGAGDGNNGRPGRGGQGGGLVFVIAGAVAGTGNILANGENGANADSSSPTFASGDAAGGGGGGGTVVVHAGTLASGITVAANGGLGGNQLITNGSGGAEAYEAEGPGGGGGGGYIALSGSTPTTVTANGALGGTTNSAGLTEFPSDGATAGHAGLIESSAASSLLFCTDALAPVTIIVTHPSNPSNVAQAPFTFSSTGNAVTDSAVPADGTVTFECNLDGAGYAACPAAYTTPTLTDGPHTISVRATDLSGNTEATPVTFDWVVDLIAPDTTIVGHPPDPSTSATGEFTFTSNEASEEIITFECHVDTAAYAACTADYTTAALADGSHTLYVRAKDAAGNVGAPVSYTWTVHATGADAGVDAAPPDTAVDTAPDAAVIDGGLVSGDAGELDSGGDTSPKLDSADGPAVLLDARADVAAVVDIATNRDVPVVTPDAQADVADGGGLGLGDTSGEAGGLAPDAAGDARVVVDVVAPPSSDSSAGPDQALLTPDAAQVRADTAVPVIPGPDAAMPMPSVKVMGSGFCTVNPVRDSAPGLFTLFLVGAFGLLVLRRRRQ